MGTSLLILIFVALFFGMILLALTMGILSHEEERATAEAQRAPTLGAVEGPRFFLRPETSTGTGPPKATEAPSLVDIEAHLSEESRLIQGFVAQPSFGELFVTMNGPSEDYLESLEQHLREERRHVAAFVARPSAEGLRRGNGRASPTHGGYAAPVGLVPRGIAQ